MRRSLPVALGNWGLDSGGFSELSMYGEWRTSPGQYAGEAQRYREQIGGMDFAAIQDWMCEPFILAKTGKTVLEHQERSVQSYLDLKALAPELPWVPVLQGWKIPDYLDHAAIYQRAGVDLGSLPRVGVGSVCRRQAQQQAVDLFAELRFLKLKLHGFGLKVGFLKHVFRCGLESFDSMAWSFRARRARYVMEGCTHKSCSNCMRFALAWRDEVCSIRKRAGQPLLI